MSGFEGYIIGGLILALLWVSGCWWNERQERIAAENNAVNANEYMLKLAARIRATCAKTESIDEHADIGGWGRK